MSDHNARWKENGKKIILNAQYWIWIWVALFAALYLNDPAPHAFLAVSIPLGLLWLVLLTLTWRYNSFILLLITAVVCRSSLSIAYPFFKLENQVQEIQGLALGFATVGALMIFTRACVCSVPRNNWTGNISFLNYGELRKKHQTHSGRAQADDSLSGSGAESPRLCLSQKGGLQ